VDIVSVLLSFLPPIVILWLANLADRRLAGPEPGAEGRLRVVANFPKVGTPDEGRRILSLLSYALIAGLFGLLIVGGLIASAAGWLWQQPGAAEGAEMYRELGMDPAILPNLGLALWLPSVFGIVLLLRPSRRLLSRLIPIDPHSVVHAIALSYTMLVTTNLLATLGFGLGNVARQLEQLGPINIMPALWVQEALMALMALVGVGWLARRGLASALARLAIVRPTLRQVALGVGGGAALAGLILGVELLVSRAGISAGADVEKLSEQLLGPLMKTWAGIITVGAAAALGEEPIFRGALQPRFGLLLTSVLFALLHSTYGLSIATIFVFVVGMVLGLVRQRANTTTTMLMHAAYNMTLGTVSYLGLLRDL